MLGLEHSQIESPRYYILVGDQDTWKVSIKHGVWGFSDRSKGSWNTSGVGDHLAFYVTSPVKKVIGFGQIKRKYIDTTLLWPDEKLFGRSLWKYRFEFDKMFTIDDWEEGLNLPDTIMLNVGRKVVSREIFLQLLKEADMRWKTKLMAKNRP